MIFSNHILFCILSLILAFFASNQNSSSQTSPHGTSLVILFNQAPAIAETMARIGEFKARKYVLVDQDYDSLSKDNGVINSKLVLGRLQYKIGTQLPEWGIIKFNEPFLGIIQGGPKNLNYKNVIDSMITLVRDLKSAYPNTKWTWLGAPALPKIFGKNNDYNWMTASQEDKREILKSVSSAFQPLISELDWVCPSVVSVYDPPTISGLPLLSQTNDENTWREATVRLAKLLAAKKPLIPIVSPWWQSDHIDESSRIIPVANFIENQVQTSIKSGANGIALWSDMNHFIQLATAKKDIKQPIDSNVDALRKDFARDYFGGRNPANWNSDEVRQSLEQHVALTVNIALESIRLWEASSMGVTTPVFPTPGSILGFPQNSSDNNAFEGSKNAPPYCSKIAESAQKALTAIPHRQLQDYNGPLIYIGTNWQSILLRSKDSEVLQNMITQLKSIAQKCYESKSDRYKRPETFVEIPPDMLESSLVDLRPVERRDMWQLANVDTIQTSYLVSSGLSLAIVAKNTKNPNYLAKCIEMLEEVNKYKPLQRPGNTYADPKVPILPGGDGVWLATGWGIDAIVDMLTILGDDVPADLRERLRLQLWEEVQRIVDDWLARRPWFVKSRNAISNQWIVPTIGLIKACLFLGDPSLLPAYNLGTENLASSLATQGADGAGHEGVVYSDMTFADVHQILSSMSLSGDNRCSDTPFARLNWKWFMHMYMPGRMLVNSFDSPRSTLPDWGTNLPMTSLGLASIATSDPDAISTLKFMFPNLKGNYSLAAIKFADVMEATPVLASNKLKSFEYFPSQQQLVWRSAFQPPASEQTAFGLWMRGGDIHDNHTHRDQGQVSIYCGNRVILMECGTCEYGDPLWEPYYTSEPGHSVLQIGALKPHGKPVNAPINVLSLNESGGAVTINCAAGFPSTIQYVRSVEWNRDGLVKIDDNVELKSEVPASTEFFRFHTGSVSQLEISGRDREWEVKWRGVTMKLSADCAIEVSQETMPDKVIAPFNHQTVLIKSLGAAKAMKLLTEIRVDTTLTNSVN